MNVSSLIRITQTASIATRNFNCWTASITKRHRKVYARTYPTILVQPNGSSIMIDYYEPKRIVILPFNIADASEEERKMILERRNPKKKVRIVEEIEDDFDEQKYIKLMK